MHRSNRWSPFIILILVLPFLLFWRWVLKGEVLFWGTALFQFWPWRHLTKTIALSGQWPLWNPLLGNGTPLMANFQTAVFYPPNLLYLFLPVEHGLTLSIILHLILAGLFMYSYARHVNLTPFAATVSALAYMFSGYLVGRTQFVTMVNAAAWLPLLLLLSDRVATRPTGKDILWLGLALAAQLLAGHAQLWFYGLWLTAAYTLFRSWQAAHSRIAESAGQRTTNGYAQRGRSMLAGGVRLGLAIGLSVLLAAVQVLPTLEFTSQSPRNSGAEHTFALTYSFWPWRLLTLLAPDFFGNPANGDYWGYANYWEDHAYVGVLPFLLALLAIWRYFRSILRQRNRHSFDPSFNFPFGFTQGKAQDKPPIANQVVPFFVALIPLSLVLAMGWNTPIYLWVFNNLPGFGYFQAPARLLIWYTIAVAVLAGVGAQLVHLAPRNRRGWQRLLVAGPGMIIAGGAASMFLTGRSRTFLAATLTLGLLMTLSIVLLLARPAPRTAQDKRALSNRTERGSGNSLLRSASSTMSLRQVLRKKEIIWQWSVLLFISIDLLLAAFPLIPTLPAGIFSRPIASAEFLKNQPGNHRFFVDEEFDYRAKFGQYFQFDSFGPLQTDYWQGFRESLAPNMGVYTGLPSANNADPLVVERWQQLMDLLKEADQTRRARLLSLMNVGYVIDTSIQNGWPTIYDNGSTAVQQVPDVLPRSYFVPQAYQADPASEALVRLTSSDFDPGHEVIIIDTGDASDESFSISTEADDYPGQLERVGRLNHDQTGDERNRHAVEVWPVAVTGQGPNRVLLSVDAPTRGFVVLTDTFYPGWQATVDGQPVRIQLANLAFRAVAVEAGKHEIVFSYRPISFTVGLWVSIATLLTVTMVLGSLWLKNRNR